MKQWCIYLTKLLIVYQFTSIIFEAYVEVIALVHN